MLRLFRTILIMVSVCYSLMATQSSSGEIIAGFGEFTFGLSKEEVAAMIDIEKLHENSDGEKLYENSDGPIFAQAVAAQPVNVLGYEYTLSFNFNREGLSKINLGREVKGSEVGCMNEFDEVLAQIRAKYGDSDSAPEIKRYQLGAIAKAKFTGPDGSMIRISSLAAVGFCTRHVSYVTGKSGRKF